MTKRFVSALTLSGALIVAASVAFAHDGTDVGAGFGGDFHGQDSFNNAGQAAQSFDNNHPVAAQDAHNAANDYGYGYGYAALGPGGTSTGSGASAAAAQGAAAAGAANSTGAGYAAGIQVGPGAMPANAQTVVAGGVTYRYANGLFYKPSAGNFAIADPPMGATVNSLPPGSVELDYGAGKPPLYYDKNYAGYYAAAGGGSYTVVTPPKGTVVPSIPKEFTTVLKDGVQYDQYNGLYYRQFFSGGNVVYAVS
jgi:hypothetical protein